MSHTFSVHLTLHVYTLLFSPQPGGKDVPVNIHNLDEYLKVGSYNLHVHVYSRHTSH